MNRGDRLGLITRSIELRHAHASEADGRDLETLGSQLSALHVLPSFLQQPTANKALVATRERLGVQSSGSSKIRHALY